MTVQKCCRTCKHCASSQPNQFSVCRLRKIKIHSEISTFDFCHHWIKKEPSLPDFQEALNDQLTDRQLDFGKVLVSKDK